METGASRKKWARQNNVFKFATWKTRWPGKIKT